MSPVGKISSAIKQFYVKVGSLAHLYTNQTLMFLCSDNELLLQGLGSPTDEGTVLGAFEYKTEEPPIQTFDVVSKVC